MSVTIRKINLYPHGCEPSGRVRTGEAIIIDYGTDTSVRYEFDYDDDNFYVYRSLFFKGRATNTSYPVRAIPRKRV